MPTDDIVQKVNRIMVDDFEVEPDLLKPEAALGEDLGLDSLDGVDLMVAVEKEFGCRIKEADARAMRTLNDIYEYIERAPSIVVKKDGRREQYDRDKILTGLIKACEKRPVSREQLEKLLDDVESATFGKFKHEVKTSVLGKELIDRLQELDEVAYVRFASVYRQFKDINQFMSELKTLLDKSGSDEGRADGGVDNPTRSGSGRSCARPAPRIRDPGRSSCGCRPAATPP